MPRMQSTSRGIRITDDDGKPLGIAPHGLNSDDALRAVGIEPPAVSEDADELDELPPTPPRPRPAAKPAAKRTAAKPAAKPAAKRTAAKPAAKRSR